MFRIAYQGLERDAMRELPPAAQSVLQRALAKHPAQRYPTCGEMADALANAFFRTAPAATRVASVAEFAAVELKAPPAPKSVAAESSGVKRHFSREALKYFGVTFVLCALALAAVFYFLMPKAPAQPVPIAPVVTQPAPGPHAVQPVSVQPVSVQPAPPPQSPEKAPEAKTKAPAKPHAKKKEPEVDVKPAEPKIIRQ